MEKILALPDLTGRQKQNAYMLETEACYMQKDFPGTLAGLKKALAAAPKSENAAGIQSMIEQLKPVAALAEFERPLAEGQGPGARQDPRRIGGRGG